MDQRVLAACSARVKVNLVVLTSSNFCSFYSWKMIPLD